MTTSLVFIDTETTGLHPGRRAWEIAMIRRDPDGRQRELVMQVRDVDLSDADPIGLRIGGFYDRHRILGTRVILNDEVAAWEEEKVAGRVEQWTRGAHLVGVNPGFDAETLAPMLRRHRLVPSWHYHLVDVLPMAAGYLHGLARQDGHECIGSVKTWSLETASADPPVPPWKSDAVAEQLGVEPPAEDERHTALGDARWAMRIYDAITGERA